MDGGCPVGAGLLHHIRSDRGAVGAVQERAALRTLYGALATGRRPRLAECAGRCGTVIIHTYIHTYILLLYYLHTYIVSNKLFKEMTGNAASISGVIANPAVAGDGYIDSEYGGRLQDEKDPFQVGALDPIMALSKKA